MIAEKNSVFIYSLKEWLTHPWRFFWGNLGGLWDWLSTYWNWPMLILLAYAVFTFWQYFRKKALLLVWFGAPFIALALFGRVLYPRFIFSMSLSLLPMIALALKQFFQKIKNPGLIGAVVLFLVFPWFRADYQLLTTPATASIPKADKNQYFNDWPAGGGIREVVEFLNQESQKGKVYVATEGTFGPLPYALEVYLYKNHNVEIKGFWPLKKEMPEEVLEAAKTRPTYFVFNQTQTVPLNWPLQFIAKYRKGVSEVFLHLYQVVVD